MLTWGPSPDATFVNLLFTRAHLVFTVVDTCEFYGMCLRTVSASSRGRNIPQNIHQCNLLLLVIWKYRLWVVLDKFLQSFSRSSLMWCLDNVMLKPRRRKARSWWPIERLWTLRTGASIFHWSRKPAQTWLLILMTFIFLHTVVPLRHQFHRSCLSVRCLVRMSTVKVVDNRTQKFQKVDRQLLRHLTNIWGKIVCVIAK